MTAVLALLGRVPFLVWPLLVALAWGWTGHHKARGYQADMAEMRATAAETAHLANLAARTEETRRRSAQEEVIRAQTQDLARARADAAAAGDAAGRLRALLARASAAGGAARDPAAAPQRPPAPAAVADVLGACVERYRGLAQEADTARAAGLACESSYDALMAPR
jgi:hypothetical protein